MSMSEQGGYALPPARAAAKARAVRTVRLVLAVPFWALLTLTIVSWPTLFVAPNLGWVNAGAFLAPILLVPVALIRAISTISVLGFSRRRIARFSGPPGCLVGFGIFAGVFFLSAAAGNLATALVATTPVNAKVTECHSYRGQRGQGHTDCVGDWTVNGTVETGKPLPVVGQPGSTVPILVSNDAANVAYAPPDSTSRAIGTGVGLLGIVVTGASLFRLITNGRRIRRALSVTTPKPDLAFPPQD